MRVDLVGAGEHVGAERAQRLAHLTQTPCGEFTAVLAGHERERDFPEAAVHPTQPRQQTPVRLDHCAPSVSAARAGISSGGKPSRTRHSRSQRQQVWSNHIPGAMS